MGKPSFTRWRKLQAEAQAYLDEKDLVFKDQSNVPRARRFAHFWVLVARSFQRNRCPVRASSLAYTTLLALIPLLAVVVSVSTSFLKIEGDKTSKAIDSYLERFISNIAPQLDLVENPDAEEAAINRRMVVEKIKGFIENIHSGKLGVTAGLALVFVAISLLTTIEATFNDIWGITRGRGWVSRVVLYWAAITLGPLVLFVALGFAAAPGDFMDRVPYLRRSVAFLLVLVAFTLFYKQIPNTRVHWKAALAGGVVGGTLWQLNNMFSVIYLSRVVTYSKIYGSMGVVPIFLIGLYFSWLILLFGSQVAYAFQNRGVYLQEKQAESINQRGREFIAFRLMTFIAQRFLEGAKPPSRVELSTTLGIPSQVICHILTSLVQAKLLVETLGEETGYAPAKPLARISAEDILLALRVGQGQELATAEDPAREIVRHEFEKIMSAESVVAQKLTLEQLALEAKGEFEQVARLAASK